MFGCSAMPGGRATYQIRSASATMVVSSMPVLGRATGITWETLPIGPSHSNTLGRAPLGNLSSQPGANSRRLKVYMGQHTPSDQRVLTVGAHPMTTLPDGRHAWAATRTYWKCRVRLKRLPSGMMAAQYVTRRSVLIFPSRASQVSVTRGQKKR